MNGHELSRRDRAARDNAGADEAVQLLGDWEDRELTRVDRLRQPASGLLEGNGTAHSILAALITEWRAPARSTLSRKPSWPMRPNRTSTLDGADSGPAGMMFDGFGNGLSLIGGLALNDLLGPARCAGDALVRLPSRCSSSARDRRCLLRLAGRSNRARPRDVEHLHVCGFRTVRFCDQRHIAALRFCRFARHGRRGSLGVAPERNLAEQIACAAAGL